MNHNRRFQWETALEQIQGFAQQLSEQIDSELVDQALCYTALRRDMKFSRNEQYSVASLLAVMSLAIEHNEESKIHQKNDEALTSQENVSSDTH